MSLFWWVVLGVAALNWLCSQLIPNNRQAPLTELEFKRIERAQERERLEAAEYEAWIADQDGAS